MDADPPHGHMGRRSFSDADGDGEDRSLTCHPSTPCSPDITAGFPSPMTLLGTDRRRAKRRRSLLDTEVVYGSMTRGRMEDIGCKIEVGALSDMTLLGAGRRQEEESPEDEGQERRSAGGQTGADAPRTLLGADRRRAKRRLSLRSMTRRRAEDIVAGIEVGGTSQTFLGAGRRQEEESPEDEGRERRSAGGQTAADAPRTLLGADRRRAKRRRSLRSMTGRRAEDIVAGAEVGGSSHMTLLGAYRLQEEENPQDEGRERWSVGGQHSDFSLHSELTPAGIRVAGCPSNLSYDITHAEDATNDVRGTAPAPNEENDFFSPILHCLVDDIMLKIFRELDLKSLCFLSITCRIMRSLIRKNLAPCCQRYLPLAQRPCIVLADDKYRVSLGILSKDIIFQVMTKLSASDIARLGSTCRALRCIIASADAFTFLRKNLQKGYLLGAIVNCRALSKYPVLLSLSVPVHQQRAVNLFRQFWRKVSRSKELQKNQIVDCRDGHLLLIDESLPSSRLILCNPLSVNSSIRILPEYARDVYGDKAAFLASAYICQDNESFSIIVLNSSATLEGTMFLVRMFMSKSNVWISKAGSAISAMPEKSMLRLPTAVAANKVHFLHRGVQIVAVDLNDLNLDTISLPPVAAMDNHILVEKRNGELCLAVLTDQTISLYQYISSSASWFTLKKMELPDESECRIAGSGREKILIHSADQLFSLDLIDGEYLEVARSSLVQEAFCYEQELPPRMEFLRKLC